MNTNPKFDDIRPYEEEEIPAAMQRIADSDVFPLLASFVYPTEKLDDVRHRIRAFKTVREFQHDAMRRVNEQIIARSISDFSVSGLERLSPTEHYLFVSNHRDIMLDASLLQYYFVMNGFDTTEITFGANLMTHPVVIDVGKSNKMFKVARPSADMKEFYRSSMHLSEYIRYTIKEKGQSVWIAQRNGRTKNGMDQTDQGIIKMFCMSDSKDKIRALAELNIVPIAISYEWESCDILKALELYESEYTKYTKKPGEDLNSILTGILQPKGRVHIAICQPIRMAELSAFERQTSNEYHKSVARLIDDRINTAYRLYPNNYIAHDILYGNTRYQSMYTESEYELFRQHLSELDCFEETCDIEHLREIFVGIYANPVDNR
jgi:1-acyl-sn-glycerol-3-phosphate acyltransferase